MSTGRGSGPSTPWLISIRFSEKVRRCQENVVNSWICWRWCFIFLLQIQPVGNLLPTQPICFDLLGPSQIPSWWGHGSLVIEQAMPQRSHWGVSQAIVTYCNESHLVYLLSTCLLTDLSMDSFNWVMIIFRGKNMVILLNIMLYKFVGVARFPIETIPCIYWRWCLICPRLIPLLGGQRRVEGVSWIILVVSWNGGSPSHHRFQY